MKVYRSQAKMVGLTLLALVMAVLLGFVGFGGYQREGAGNLPLLIGIIGGGFFFISFILLLIKALDRRPALDFSAEGLLIPDAAKERIKWDDLLAARLFQVHRQKFIELQIKPQAVAALSLRRMTKLNNKAMGKSDDFITVAMSGLTMPADRVLELVGKRGEE